MVQSCFPTLAASPPAAAWKDFDFATWPTSPLAIHVRGFNRNSSGRSSRRGHIGSITTHSLRHCRYKTVAGRSAWLTRDPITDIAFRNINGNQPSSRQLECNLYLFLKNNPADRIDGFGLDDSVTSTTIHCTRLPRKDFLFCICTFITSDENEEQKCEHTLGACAQAIGDPKNKNKLCKCACQQAYPSDPCKQNDCNKACDAAFH